MELELYTALKTEILTKLPAIKHVALFNNQFEHSNGMAKDEIPFKYPCVFLEFSNYQYEDLSQGVQAFTMSLKTHLGFISYTTDDIEILTLKQELYSVVDRFRNGYFARLKRITDTPDYNHDNWQVYVTEYHTAGKDYTKDIRPTTDVTATISLSAYTTSLSAIITS